MSVCVLFAVPVCQRLTSPLESFFFAGVGCGGSPTLLCWNSLETPLEPQSCPCFSCNSLLMWWGVGDGGGLLVDCAGGFHTHTHWDRTGRVERAWFAHFPCSIWLGFATPHVVTSFPWGQAFDGEKQWLLWVSFKMLLPNSFFSVLYTEDLMGLLKVKTYENEGGPLWISWVCVLRLSS